MPNDPYSVVASIAAAVGGGAGYSNDTYGQWQRIADTVGNPAAGYTSDIYGQILRVADAHGSGTFSNDIYGQLRRIAESLDPGGGAAYSNDIYGQLRRILDNAAAFAGGGDVGDLDFSKDGNPFMHGR